jgi:hypothetical protein
VTVLKIPPVTLSETAVKVSIVADIKKKNENHCQKEAAKIQIKARPVRLVF